MRLARAFVAVFAAMLLTAGCASKEPATSTPTFDTVLSPTPSAAPATSTPAAPAYPASCKTYSEAVLAAWKNHNVAKLGELSTPLVQDQIISIPGPPNMNWKFIRVTALPGTETCHFYNNSGEVIRLGIAMDLLGQPHAAVKVNFDEPEYPATGIDYVKALITAWQDGNEPLMLLLSKPDVVTGLKETKKPSTYNIQSESGGAGLLLVTVTASGGLALEFHVGTTLLGQKHAVVGMTY